MEWKRSHLQEAVVGENHLTVMLLYMNYVMEVNAEWKMNLDNVKHDKSASFTQTRGFRNTDKHDIMASSDKRCLW